MWAGGSGHGAGAGAGPGSSGGRYHLQPGDRGFDALHFSLRRSGQTAGASRAAGAGGQAAVVAERSLFWDYGRHLGFCQLGPATSERNLKEIY